MSMMLSTRSRNRARGASAPYWCDDDLTHREGCGNARARARHKRRERRAVRRAERDQWKRDR